MRDDLLFSENNFFISHTLKRIDSNVGYKEENQLKLIKNLQDSSRELNKEFFLKNKKMYLELMRKRALRLEEMKRNENSRNNVRELNMISSPYNMEFLPKISPFIQSNDNVLIMDNKKAEKVGSKGFDYICTQEKLLKLANIKKEPIVTEKKENKNDNNNKSNNKQKNPSKSDNNINIKDNNDIFDLNYNDGKKDCNEIIELRNRLNRIITQNKKVEDKFNLYKTMLIKFRVRQIYHPKYDSIEKHKPVFILYSRTRRIFPEAFIPKSYYKEPDISSRSTRNKNYKLKEKRKKYYICSSNTANIFSNTFNIINDRNKTFRIKKNNKKFITFNISESNKSNTIDNSLTPKENKFNITNLKKSKSHFSIFGK